MALSDMGLIPHDFVAPTKRQSKERETDTEAYFKRQVSRLGGRAMKFKSPATRSRPDQIAVLPVNHIFFCELKAEGVKPSDAQLDEHRKLRAVGATVHVADTKAAVDEVLRIELIEASLK